MKTIILVLITLFAFSLYAEDSLQIKTKEQLQLQQGEMIQNRERIHANNNDQDVFIDKNSDGIADNRNFQERHRNWHRNRQLSGKVFRSGSCHKWQRGQSGQGQGNGTGSGNGSGNGGGNCG